MKILTFSAYFTPEIAASMYLTENLLEGMCKAGHDVELFVPTPTRGISLEIRAEYSQKKLETRYDGHLTIHRFWLFREGRNPILRAFRYGLLNLIFIWKGLLTKADVIFVQSTPPTQGLVSGFLRLIKRIPVVYNLQDIFPDSLVNTGLTKKGSILWKLGRIIENFTYRNADKIIVISDDFKKNIMGKGVPEDKIEVIPNWVDTNDVHPIPRQLNSLISELNIDSSKFIVLYAGNFGRAQGADIVLRAAERLIDEDKIQFVIFGGGSEFQDAIDYVVEKNLKNVIIRPLLPPERVSEVYSLGDVAIVTCKEGFGNSCVPSKTWSIMACETPILAVFDLDSELCKLIQEVQCGECICPSNVEKLTSKIIELSTNNELLNRGIRGRQYLKEYINIDFCVNKYMKVIRNCI